MTCRAIAGVGRDRQKARVVRSAGEVAEALAQRRPFRRIADRHRDVRSLLEVAAYHRGTNISGRAGDHRRAPGKVEHRR